MFVGQETSDRAPQTIAAIREITKSQRQVNHRWPPHPTLTFGAIGRATIRRNYWLLHFQHVTCCGTCTSVQNQELLLPVMRTMRKEQWSRRKMEADTSPK